jgi:hypothetical protein
MSSVGRLARRRVDPPQSAPGLSVGIGRAVLETTSGDRSAIFVGLIAAFVAAVEVIQWIRPGLLLDAEPSWQLPRYILGLFAVSAAAGAGGVAAALCTLVARSRWGNRAALPLPVRRSSLLVLGGVVLVVGVLLRVYGLSTLKPLWVDDLSEVRPAADLHVQVSDLASWSRPVPFREGRWGGSVGTLYLEFFHFCLKAFGTTMAGVRAPSAIGGILSLFTAAYLGRAFLPRGGGVLTALVLAGLRWNLIISQWGWNAIILAPILDLATLSMLEARRRNRLHFAGLSGAIAAVGAHVYLASWVGAAGLGLWAIWPSAKVRTRKRALLGAIFVVGFVLVALPLLRDDPFGHYFARVAHRSHSLQTVSPALRVWWETETAHAALTAPWWTRDLVPRHGLPGQFRLEWIVGAALAAGLLKALLAPRDELSAFLLTSAIAAFLSTMAWGLGETPNSYRYTYLSTTTALAAAAGAMWLLSAIPWSRRRGAAYLMMGGFAISGALGARDALIVWPQHRATFEAFGGWDTLVGQAAARWDPYSAVRIDPSIGGAPIVYESARAISPDRDEDRKPAKHLSVSIRIVGLEVRPNTMERVVERIHDDWGQEYGEVLVASTAYPKPRGLKPKHPRAPRGRVPAKGTAN